MMTELLDNLLGLFCHAKLYSDKEVGHVFISAT